MTVDSDARRRVLLSADRMMADIDRITFVLPEGGPVTSEPKLCWADKVCIIPLYGAWLVSCDELATTDVLLCDTHYPEKVAA